MLTEFPCGYSHPWASCHAYSKECYKCHGTGHFTVLCKKPHSSRNSWDKHTRSPKDIRAWSHRSSSHRHLRRLTSRSRQSHCSMNNSPSINHPYSCRSPHHPGRRSSTPYRHQVSHISVIKSWSNHKEGKFITDTASDGHTSFHTTLKIITSQGSKSLPIKVDPCADVIMIPLSRYYKLLPKHFTKAGSLKWNAL